MIDVLAGRRLLAEEGTPVVTTSFPRDEESVRAARQFVHAALLDWKLPELADTAELVVSELATNAILHARCVAFRVTLQRRSDDQVHIAVIDRSGNLPQMGAPGDHEEHGRGLALVDALSQRWGIDSLRWGKRVWADLELPEVVDLPAPRVPIFTGRHAHAFYILTVLTVAAAIIAATVTQ